MLESGFGEHEPVASSGRTLAVGRAYPREVREEAVYTALNRKPGTTIEQIATEFGVHPMTLQEWLRHARDEAGKARELSSIPPGAAELQEARAHIRLLEQENAVLRQAAAYLSEANLLGQRVQGLLAMTSQDGARQRGTRAP